MPDISKFDPNLAIKEVSDDGESEYYGCLSEPFKVYGLMPPDETSEVFHRMDVKVAEKVNDGVSWLCLNSAGGRVKFKTDSPYIIIKATLSGIYKADHFALCGAAGFDIYSKESDGVIYVNTVRFPFDMTDGYTSQIFTNSTEMKEYIIHFPLYSNVNALSLGLKKGSKVEAPDDYKVGTPVVFYGSSITQGACASRPGMAYDNIISRELDVDHINLGFSGSARAEQVMAEYIAGLEMSAFVLDYDHNSTGPEHLKFTHKRMFDTVRAKHPDIPILMLTRPCGRLSEEEKERRDIIKQIYLDAVENGDKNVGFIDMSEVVRQNGGNEATVDNCHPTDLGFRLMADAVIPKLKEMLKI